MVHWKCVVTNCKSKWDAPGHFFPKNTKLCEAWRRVINNEIISNLSNEELRKYRVCHLHFRDSAYIFSLHRRKLKHDAVPTLNLPSAQMESIKTECTENMSVDDPQQSTSVAHVEATISHVLPSTSNIPTNTVKETRTILGDITGQKDVTLRVKQDVDSHVGAFVLGSLKKVNSSKFKKMDRELAELAVALYDIDAVKFGEFVTKTGLKTPIYFDLRVVIAHPKIMVRLAKALWKLAGDSADEISQICGVPYTALPVATLISVDANIPMIIKRKEAKDYGTKKDIEGKFVPGDNCVIIEDVVTSGSSILETVNGLAKEGLKVSRTFVVIDREQGGRKNLDDRGIKMQSLFTVTELMQCLLEAEKITADTVRAVLHYTQVSTAPVKLADVSLARRMSLRYNDRAKETKNEVATRLFQLMESKRTNLCLAVDIPEADSILKYADICGPHVAVLKIHVDIIEDFNVDFMRQLKELAKKHEFLLMEDRKFADIGSTVAKQYGKGIYKIAQWADLITVHAVPGSTIMDGLKSALNGIAEPRGVFLVAEMSSKNALTTGDYVRNALSIARNYPDFLVGLVCQSNIFSEPGLIQLTPGVKLTENSDALGQQYNTPESVINSGADLAVVGRGIIQSKNVLKTTLEYKEELWSAYEKRTSAN